MEAAIGFAAGKIWQTLNSKGPMAKSAIAKATGLAPDVLDQGIGWLAREGKLTVVKAGRVEQLKLKG
ncbi:MAG TPA: winged helix-turn-helix domain-containing protein [Planctomycetota bacterium]|nr:winged helix-turn-helix domain-containing protein [Planctomycetota bacterium]